MKLFIKPVLAIALFLSATTANALLLQISLSSDFSTNVITADDADGDGVVNITAIEGITGGLGNWSVNVVTGLSTPAIGKTNVDKLDLNSVNVTGAAGGTLYLRLTDTDFVGDNLGLMHFISAFGGTTNGIVSFESFVDSNNAEFGQGTLLSDSGPISGTAFSGLDSGMVNLPNSYSISIFAVIRHAGPGQVTSFDSYVSVPEPGTLALIGIGLLGLGMLRRPLPQRVRTK